MPKPPFFRSLRPDWLRRDRDAEIREELEHYLELRAEELEAQGLTPEEARREAREKFGDAEKIAGELRREARRRRIQRGRRTTMGGLKQDLAYAVRTFRRSPGFTTVAVLTLGLALGGNTAIYSVVDGALLDALPFDEHESLVFVNGVHRVDGESAFRGASFPEFRDWRERSRAFSEMAAITQQTLVLTGDGAAERLLAEVVTDEYFDAFRIEPALGRAFRPEEHAELGAHPVVVLSDALYERRFARDPGIVGRTLVLNDRTMTVIGVMSPGFGGVQFDADLWLPDGMIGVLFGDGVLDARGSRFLDVVGRLAPGADLATAQSELDVVARDLQASFPRAHEDRFAQLVPFREGYLGDTSRLLWILLGAGSVLLLIAAANVANLLLVRAHNRTREIVLRRALGAEGRRVAAQLMTESLTLAALGGFVGVGVAAWALATLTPLIPQGVLPGYVEPRLSGSAFLYSLGILTAVGVVCGLIPAVSSARMDIASRLREGARSGGSGAGTRLRTQHVFVVAQVALALVLLVGAGLLTRSFQAQLAVDPGADIDGVVAARVQLPRERFPGNEEILDFVRRLDVALAEQPEVERYSVSSDLPFRFGSQGAYIFREGEGVEDAIRFHRHLVSGSFFETLGVELLDGRYLSDRDVDDSPGVIVVTEAFVDRVYPGERAVGKRMSLRPDGTFEVEIVGVIENVRYRNLTTSLMEDANSPDVFFSFWQLPPRSIEIAARGRGDVTALGAALRRTVVDLDPDLSVFRVEPLEVAYRAETATPRMAALLMTLFSALAVVLAGVGIYGVLAFAVGQRSREIAIRRAVGASAGSVAGGVVRDALRLVGIGLLVGGATAVGGATFLERFLFGVDTTDPLTFIGVCLALLVVAVGGAMLPAFRAMRRDPAEALNTQ